MTTPHDKNERPLIDEWRKILKKAVGPSIGLHTTIDILCDSYSAAAPSTERAPESWPPKEGDALELAKWVLHYYGWQPELTSKDVTYQWLYKLAHEVHALRTAAPSAIEERLLTKPAMVGNTRFGVGIKWSTVIGRAEREYEYQVTPEKEAARMERVRTFVDSISIKDGPHREESTISQVGVCPRCGVNRFEAACPNGHTAETTGQCPMVGTGASTDGGAAK